MYHAMVGQNHHSWPAFYQYLFFFFFKRKFHFFFKLPFLCFFFFFFFFFFFLKGNTTLFTREILQALLHYSPTLPSLLPSSMEPCLIMLYGRGILTHIETPGKMQRERGLGREACRQAIIE